MTKLLRYEDRKSGIDYYGLSDNEFFKNKKPVVVKENATKQDLLDKKHDIKNLNLKYDWVIY